MVEKACSQNVDGTTPDFLQQPRSRVYVWIIGDGSGHNGPGNCLKELERPAIRKVSRTW